METNQYGQVQISDSDMFDALYSGNIKNLEGIYLSNSKTINRFNQSRLDNGDQFAELSKLVVPNLNIEDFDKQNQENWFMPEEYKILDIETWVRQQCPPWDPHHARVEEELKLFAQYNMILLLKWCKYFVDTCRANNIVWGVGRGSSVASYVLYLIGVHRIDSIKYNLDINEFLK